MKILKNSAPEGEPQQEKQEPIEKQELVEEPKLVEKQVPTEEQEPVDKREFFEKQERVERQELVEEAEQKVTGEPNPESHHERRRIPLFGEILMIVGFLMIATVLGAGVKMLVEKSANATAEFATFLAYTTSFGATILFALWLRHYNGHKRPLLRLTLRKTNPSIILWGVLLVVICSVVIEPLISIFPTHYLDGLNDSIGRGFWTVMTLVVAAPILEEILFRGIIQELVTRRIGVLWGVLLSAALFGVIHIIPQQVVNAFFIGIILGYVYIKTQSLWAVITIHGINNAIAYITILVYDGKHETLQDIMGGGTYYWMVYAVAALIMIVAGVGMYKSIRRAEKERKLSMN